MTEEANIFAYGFSLQGKSHKAENVCCQDSNKITKVENLYIVAVADGVGSAANSQRGSSIAVNVATDYFSKNYSKKSDIRFLIKQSFAEALNRIFEDAKNNNFSIESYDTTLMMAVYDGQKMAFGHSGDGAIIGLTNSGDFIEITSVQKGLEKETVIPLRAGSNVWQIDTCDKNLAAILLLTDGMLDIICQPRLKLYKTGNSVYVPLASYFLDLKGICKNQTAADVVKNIEEFVTAEKDYNKNTFYACLSAIYKQHLSEEDANQLIEEIKRSNVPVDSMQNVTDDKTVVGLINTDIAIENKSLGFYKDPDWLAIYNAWYKELYPHLCRNKDAVSHESSVEVSENEEIKQMARRDEEIKSEKADNYNSEGYLFFEK